MLLAARREGERGEEKRLEGEEEIKLASSGPIRGATGGEREEGEGGMQIRKDQPELMYKCTDTYIHGCTHEEHGLCYNFYTASKLVHNA